MARLSVLSDLHISGPDDPVYEALLDVIENRTGDGDTLVLAGDIFDLFVGGKYLYLDRYRRFFDALRVASDRGVVLHYIEGNHDFLLKGAFRETPRLRLHPSQVEVVAHGKRFLIAHGDLVDRGDIGYLLLRAFFRSPLMKALVAMLPARALDWIGRKSSEASRGRRQSRHLPAPGRLEELRKVYRSYAAERLAEGYDFVVLGHCHDLDEKSFQIGSRPGQYINVGFPPVHGSYLTWSPGDGKIQRERLPL